MEMEGTAGKVSGGHKGGSIDGSIAPGGIPQPGFGTGRKRKKNPIWGLPQKGNPRSTQI